MSSHPRKRTLSVIGAPSSAGAYGPGQEGAPAAFRRHGLISRLQARGLQVSDRDDGIQARWRADASNPSASNVDLVATVARGLADTVAAAMAQGHNTLVLGGDCTTELGTVAGAIRDGASIGLAYIDLDADLNTPATGDGILDWMGLAHLLNVPGSHDTLASVGHRRPMLTADAVRLLAVDKATEPEQALIDSLQIGHETLLAVLTEPSAVTARIRTWAEHFDRILIHLDIDVLDQDKFPIAENTSRRGGLDLVQLTGLLTDLCSLPNWRALTVTEINPSHAPEEHHSFQQLVAMLAEALGQQNHVPRAAAGG